MRVADATLMGKAINSSVPMRILYKFSSGKRCKSGRAKKYKFSEPVAKKALSSIPAFQRGL